MSTTRQGRTTLVEYLGRVRDEEKRIETALAAHLVMVGRPSYQKRLERHLEATKVRATELEKQIKRLGGTVSRTAAGGSGTREVRAAAKRVTDRAVELAEGPVEKLRLDAEAAKLLDNARAEYADAAAQVGNYSVVRALAKAAGDKSTGRLAKSYRAEHEDLAEYVRKLIPKLSKAAVEAEAGAPASRSGARTSPRPARSRAASSRSASARSSSARSSTPKRATAPAKTAAGTAAKRSASSTRSAASSGSAAAKRSAASTRSTVKRGAKAATPAAKRSSPAATKN